MPGTVDTSFDVRTDAAGRDPDSHSAALRGFHRALWSKPLPRGATFDLDGDLRHESTLGTFQLASDAITNTYSMRDRPRALVEARTGVPQHEIDAFYDLGCTVGAYTVFPRPVHANGRRRISINQARGMHPRIGDRFDLTLECIRRHYLGMAHPLEPAFVWYRDFFDLFDDFPGYVRFFLLEDLVTDDFAAVRFLIDFDGFQRTPLPLRSADEYRTYMDRSMDFVRARNSRVDRYVQAA